MVVEALVELDAFLSLAGFLRGLGRALADGTFDHLLEVHPLAVEEDEDRDVLRLGAGVVSKCYGYAVAGLFQDADVDRTDLVLERHALRFASAGCCEELGSGGFAVEEMNVGENASVRCVREDEREEDEENRASEAGNALHGGAPFFQPRIFGWRDGCVGRKSQRFITQTLF